MRTCAVPHSMCYTARMSRAFILSLSLLLACNVCNDDVISEFAADICEPDTSTGESSSSSTTTTVDTYGDILPTCKAVPGPGEAWGPCHVGAICDAGLYCHNPGPGNVCLADCIDQTCGDGDKCIGATCDPAFNKCTAQCVTDDDCPLDGMFCLRPTCVFPAFAP